MFRINNSLRSFAKTGSGQTQQKVETGGSCFLPKGTDPSWESPEDYPKSTAALGMTDWSNCPAGDPAAQGGEVNRTFCKGVLSVTEIENGSDSDDSEHESEVRENAFFLCGTMFPA